MQITLNGKNYEVDSYKINRNLDGDKISAQVFIAWEVIDDKSKEAPLVASAEILKELEEIVLLDDRFETD